MKPDHGNHSCHTMMIVITDGLLQPPPPEDYSGEVQYYKIFAENMKERNYSAVLRQCTFLVPTGLHAISVSAATLYGTSPPANVSLRHSGARI